VTQHNAIKAYGVVEVESHSFYNSITDGSELSVSRSGCFIPDEGYGHITFLAVKRNVTAAAGNRTAVVNCLASHCTDHDAQVASTGGCVDTFGRFGPVRSDSSSPLKPKERERSESQL
jgi:hypothetical protein